MPHPKTHIMLYQRCDNNIVTLGNFHFDHNDYIGILHLPNSVLNKKKTTAKFLHRTKFPIDFNVIFVYIHCIRIVVTICIDTVLIPHLCWHSFTYTLLWHSVTYTLVLTLCYIHTCIDTLLHPYLHWHYITSTRVVTLCYFHTCIDIL